MFGMVNQHTGNHGLGIFCVVGFDLGPLLEGQMRTAKLNSAYHLLIIGPRGVGALSLRWIQFASVFRCARSSLFSFQFQHHRCRHLMSPLFLLFEL